MRKYRVLILYGDATQTLPIAKSLKQIGVWVGAICSSKWSYGYCSRYIDKKYLYSNAENIDEYFSYLINVLKTERYDAIFPMRDSVAEVMSKYKTELLKYTHFVMPDYSTFKLGFDKHKLMEVCQKKGYPHPQTYILEGNSLDNVDLDNLIYPILIKPNLTFGARGMTLCNTKDELLEKFPQVYQAYGECHLQRFVEEGGHQVELQLYVNERGELVQSSVIKKYRWYPEKGGSSCCNVSCQNTEMVSKCHRLLVDIGWVGFADFDTIEDPKTGELLIMELNPRFPACIKSAFISGVDWADVVLSEYLHLSHETYEAKDDYYLRHLGFEALWFIYSKNRFKTRPSWFKFLGKNIYYQDMSSLSDPLPFIAGTLGNIIKQLSPEFRKQKSGTR